MPRQKLRIRMNEEERIPSGIAADAERLERSGWTVDSASAAAKSAALEALGALPAPEPVASVSYMSHGRLLLIGPPEARDSMFATALSFRRELDVHVLCPERGPPLDTHSVLVWGGKLQSLTGYLGNFTVKWNGVTSESQPATSATGPVTLARSGDTPVVQFDAMQKCYTGHFDLVLDFSLPAQFRMHQPPQGYFAVGRDVDKLQSACAELSGMVGEFEKPRFFSYKEKLCAHSRAHQQGCNRCIDVCSTAAISAAGDFVAVDAHLCMGCGACATVCPSGAMSFQYPRVSDRGAQIKALLASYRVAGGGNACLLLHNGTDGRDLLAASARDGRGIPGYVIPVPVWHIASTGIDLLLGAVSYGATHVALLSTGSEAPEYAAALLEQMGHAQTILNALGYQGKHFSLLEARTAPQIEAALGDISAAMTPAVATFNLSGDKRTTLEFCLEHLAGHAPMSMPRNAPCVWRVPGHVRKAHCAIPPTHRASNSSSGIACNAGCARTPAPSTPSR
jgi:ferredoxin